uniref:Ig-like domain-containing protein n=1 Tax=Gadus morhua TaxID=8049 RepID=A0A8C5BME9_GADMO
MPRFQGSVWIEIKCDLHLVFCIPRIVSLKTARIGDTVTLHCGAREENRTSLLWYKQSIGYVPQKVASIVSSRHVKFFPPFDSSFTVKEPDIDLNIKSVSKEDEAHYFCQNYYSNDWSGFFLSVKGKFVSQTVVLQPVSASAQLGDPVALQCSITSQRTDHSNQCQGEPSVYWFRSGPSHPAAIYMNGNRSGECQDSSGPSAPQSCVYTLPKNKVDSSDAGTYYCALAACGEVVFGNGTKLDITEQAAHCAGLSVRRTQFNPCTRSHATQLAPLFDSGRVGIKCVRVKFQNRPGF